MYQKAEQFWKEKKYSEALALYRELEKENHAEAIYSIGYCYEYGRAVDIDYKIAVEKYEKAVNLGFAKAAKRIAICYEEGGYGIEQNYNTACNWYLKAQELGVGDFEYEIGTAYLKLGVKFAAEEYFTKGIEKQNGNCYASMAELIFERDHNMSKALDYYKKADELGSAIGTGMLFKIYSDLYQDYPQAFKYGKKLVEKLPGNYEEDFELLAAKAVKGNCSVSEAIELAKGYYEGVNDKRYYSAICCLVEYGKKIAKDPQSMCDLYLLEIKLNFDVEACDLYDPTIGFKKLELLINCEDCTDEVRVYYYSKKEGISEKEAEEKVAREKDEAERRVEKRLKAEEQRKAEKQRKEKERKEAEALRKAKEEERKSKWKQQGLCQYCGGVFKHGLFSTKCKYCGRKKDY